MSSASVKKALSEQLNTLSGRLSQIVTDFISSGCVSDLTGLSLLNPQVIEKSPVPYGCVNEMVIEEPTSDQETTNDLEIFEMLNKPTFKDICDFFFDMKMLRVVESINSFPHDAIPGVLLPNVISSTFAQLLQWLKEKGLSVNSISQMRIFSLNDVNYALIKFDSVALCSKSFKQLAMTEPSVSYCYDGTDLVQSNWYPVIIRDLPAEMASSDIVPAYFSEYEEEISQIIGPAVVGGVNCCMIVLNSLESAEELCYVTTQSYPSIKAHLHYRICRVRLNKDKSHFANYFESKRRNKGFAKGYVSPQLKMKKKKEMTVIDVVLHSEKSRLKKERAEQKRNERMGKKESSKEMPMK